MTRRPHGSSSRSFPAACMFLFVVFGLAIGTASAQTLRGRVLDPDARPVAGATVIVLRADAIITSAKTSSDGRFSAGPLARGGYDVLASAPGLMGKAQSIDVAGSDVPEIELRLAISAVQESVVVSASQVETPLSRAAGSVTVIDRAELLATQTHTVADALRLVPGFSIAASGGPGAVTSIFPRGGASDYTLVLVDGIPQNAFGGDFDAAHLDTAGVDRVEVVRGPESALFGDGAIGGIVQLVTRQGGPTRANASVEGGGYGFSRATASASGSSGSLRWGGSFDRLMTDGDTRVFPSIHRAVGNDDYDRVVGAGSLGWSGGPDRTIRVDVRGGRDTRGTPGPYGSDPEHLYGGLDLISRGHNTSREVGAAATFGDPRAIRHRINFTFADLQSRFVSVPFGCNPTDCALPPDKSDNRTRRVTARYQIDRDVRSVGLSAGWELLRERNDDTFITGRTFEPVPITRVDSGLFAEARPTLGRRAFLTLGARLEYIRRNALESNPGTRPAFDADVVSSLNPKVSATWMLHESARGHWTKLHASGGTGIKPPTGFDIAFTDNPSLKPERNRSVDAGVQQAIGGDSLVADATWFFNRYDDLIVTVGTSFTGASRYRTDNIANARAQGVETSLRWRLSTGLGVRAGWTFLDAEVLGINGASSVAQSPFRVGDPLIRRPRQQAFGELTWTRRGAAAFLTVNGRGGMSDLEPNFASSVYTNPGYATVAFGGSFTVARHVEVYGRVNNAFDRSYEEVFGFPAFGRTASIGVRVAGSR